MMLQDHHCIWINNCVGHENYKISLVFVLYAVIASFYSMVLIIGGAMHSLPKDEQPGSDSSRTSIYHEGVRAMWLAEKAGNLYHHPYDLGVYENLVSTCTKLRPAADEDLPSAYIEEFRSALDVELSKYVGKAYPKGLQDACLSEILLSGPSISSRAWNNSPIPPSFSERRTSAIFAFLLEESKMLTSEVFKGFHSSCGKCPNICYLLWMDTKATLEVVKYAFSQESLEPKMCFFTRLIR